ncbi:MAG: hypothetical protein GF368_03185 [Candidatus Aenigmarchaeota archaeon]|nr:hypothetical protein [Candidatus Aenigmarchaeota archaeon]
MVNPKSKNMPLYGILGFLLIILVNVTLWLNIILDLNIEVFTHCYFPFIWAGFILFVDGLVYKFRGKSLMKNNIKDFISLFLVSFLIWTLFEIIVNCIQVWNFIEIDGFSFWGYFIISSLVFSFVLPSIFEVTDLINALTGFKFKIKKFNFTRFFLYLTIFAGLILFLLPIFYSKLTFPLIWISLFLIFDPINYMNDNPSIIRGISKGDWQIAVSLLVAGIIVGFFWEFWNFWSYPKWSNSIPFFDFYRLFEIDLFGYSLYFFFSWELFSMYHFIRNIGKSYLPRITNSTKSLIGKK